MKCPKCGYLGFEPVERCRNCGYDFSLLTAVDPPELPIRDRDGREEGPLGDLALIDVAMSPHRTIAPRGATPDRTATSARPPSTVTDLPLFGSPGEDDQPLITKVPPPRPPLAVRRATPEAPRLRTEQARAPMLDLGAQAGIGDDSTLTAGAQFESERRFDDVPGEAAGLLARLMATTIDLAILVAIDVVVVYFTMKICGLNMAELGLLPKSPLVAFLLVLNGGYLVVFTAGGQTLGKMVADVRVVSTHADSRLDLGHSLVRTLVWIMLAVPAGLGFLTTLFSRDRRGLHDRCAGTRVIRASA
jgi:uncharacterized RDD family membrane protein YckC